MRRHAFLYVCVPAPIVDRAGLPFCATRMQLPCLRGAIAPRPGPEELNAWRNNGLVWSAGGANISRHASFEFPLSCPLFLKQIYGLFCSFISSFFAILFPSDGEKFRLARVTRVQGMMCQCTARHDMSCQARTFHGFKLLIC